MMVQGKDWMWVHQQRLFIKFFLMTKGNIFFPLVDYHIGGVLMQVDFLKKFRTNEVIIQTCVTELTRLKHDLNQYTLEQEERNSKIYNQELIQLVKRICLDYAERIVQCREENKQVLDVLNQMDDKYRTILNLYYIKGLNRSECAIEMQYSFQYIPELKRNALKEFERR